MLSRLCLALMQDTTFLVYSGSLFLAGMLCGWIARSVR